VINLIAIIDVFIMVVPSAAVGNRKGIGQVHKMDWDMERETAME